MPRRAPDTAPWRPGSWALGPGLRRLVWVGTAALAASVGLATAQDLPSSGGHVALRSPAGGFCDACHRSHPDRPGQYLLRTDEENRQAVTWLSVDAPGAGAVTASCLRCHFDENLRRQQPDAARLATAPGRYLGPDLADDHPLGSARPDRRQPLIQRPPPPGAGAAWVRAGTVECTACHDPHDPTMQPLPAAQQLERCGSCHAPEVAGLKGHAAVGCTACHAPHGARQAFLLRDATTEFLCNRCHGAAAAGAADWSRASSVRPLARAPEPSHGPGGSCESCHVIHR